MKILCALLIVAMLSGGTIMANDEGLIGRWPLLTDCRDHSGNGLHGTGDGVELTGSEARFDGRGSWIEVPDAPALRLGDGDFTIAAWVRTDEVLDDVVGDILSKYDPAARRGLNLGVISHSGMTSSQSNSRTLLFGVDDARETGWQDCGRPGASVFICSMAAFDGDLYVGTCEPDEGQTGHVYRHLGDDRWEDCGSPDGSNSVMAMAVHGGELYAGTASYNTKGSLLPAAVNTTPGGHVYRYLGDGEWEDCGQLPGAKATYCLASFSGDLYAIAMYVPGVFRYAGEGEWVYCGTPGEMRCMALAVHNGSLWASGNGSAGVHRYLGGEDWEFCGKQEENTQTYSFAIYEGGMYVGTWPDGSVHRYDGGTDWTNVGRMGEEKEVMAMAVYNGKMYTGTLPTGEVWRYESPGDWSFMAQIDTTPDVVYRRVWTMAIHGGWLYAGTLPAGHVYRMRAGHVVTLDRELPTGWRHVAAVREGGRLGLFVDGECVGLSEADDLADYSIDTDTPLRIGAGQHDFLNGSLRDVRLYSRALGAVELAALAAEG